MKVTYSLIVLIGTLVLVACSQDPAPLASAASQPVSQESEIPHGAQSVRASPPSDGVRIAGIELNVGFQHKVLYNRIDDRGGVRQRKIFIEALTMGAQDAEDALVKAMGSQGYTPSRRRAALGGYRLDFTGEGEAVIVALVRPRLSKAVDASPNGIIQLTAVEHEGGDASSPFEKEGD